MADRGSPIFSYLSEKTESIIEGKDFPFNFKQIGQRLLAGNKTCVKKYSYGKLSI